MSELDGVLALLILVAIVLAWVAREVQRLREDIEPLANSRLVRTLSAV